MSWLSKVFGSTNPPARLIAPSQPGDYRQDVLKNINMPVEDIIDSFRFAATMQLRTPLRVLSRHGEVSIGLSQPPDIARHQSEGYWFPITKTLAEMGINLSEMNVHSTMASDVGQIPVDGGDYLKFLIRVREIVEQRDPVESRKRALSEELRNPQWGKFIRKLGGKQAIQNSFFPAFIECIKGLPSETIHALWKAKLTTPSKLLSASDAELKAFKGIGPAKIKAIREACERLELKDSEFVDLVEL